MSKSLGNSPDPLDLIETFGADGVRVGMLLCSPAGGDLRFDESLPEQGRNFSNKIWNAFRLVKSWQTDSTIPQPESARLAVEWFDHKLSETIAAMDDHFSKYRISDALMTIYTAFWQEFSAWYLEAVKPAYQQPIDAVTYQATIGYFEKLLMLLHPFMPFITEELYQAIEQRGENDSIMVAPWPKSGALDSTMLAGFDQARDIVAAVRSIRNDKGISPKESLPLMVMAGNGYSHRFDALVVKLANVNEIVEVSDKQDGAISFMVGTIEYFVPLAEHIDVEEELEKLNKELIHQEGFLRSVMGKLNNEKFVSGAPEQVVANERKKQADAELRIEALKNSIASLKKA